MKIAIKYNCFKNLINILDISNLNKSKFLFVLVNKYLYLVFDSKWKDSKQQIFFVQRNDCSKLFQFSERNPSIHLRILYANSNNAQTPKNPFLFFGFNRVTQTSFEKHLFTEGSFVLFRNKFIIWITINWARGGFSTGGRWGMFRYSGRDLMGKIRVKLWRWVVRVWRRNVKWIQIEGCT